MANINQTVVQTAQAPSDALRTTSSDVLLEQQVLNAYQQALKNPMVITLQNRLRFTTVFLIVLVIILVLFWIYYVFITPRVDGDYIDPLQGTQYKFESTYSGVRIYREGNELAIAKRVDDHVFENTTQKQLLVWYNNLVMFYDLEDLTKSQLFVKKIE